MPIGKHGSYKQLTRLGPGGWKCGCCAPVDSKGKGALTRLFQKRYRQHTKKLITDGLNGANE